MELVLLASLFIGAAMLAMAVGVVFGNRCLRGSCGGPEALGPDGEPLTCDACPHRPSAGDDAKPTLAPGS
ncbi:MAG: hypothetical protein WBH75_00540 [Thermoanaerobaculia bacterium]